MARFTEWSPELEAALAEPFAAALVSQKKIKGSSISFVQWFHYVDRLNALVGPGWSMGEPILREVGGKLVMGVPVCIFGVTRINFGSEDEEHGNAGDDGVVRDFGSAETNAFAQALKRTCALFGLGLGLYFKKGSPVSAQPQRSVAGASGTRRERTDVDRATGEVTTEHQETESERLARNLRKLASDVDEQRKRTGEHLTAPLASAEAEDCLQDAQCTPATMKRLGASLLEELNALKQLPEADERPTYETYEAPALDSGDDELPF